MKKIALLSVLALTACGTIFSGTGQEISFDSNQKGVEIFIDGMRACKTPCKYEVDRSMSDLDIVAKKDGFRDQNITLRSNFNKMAILNTTALGSWTTDFAFGGAWEYRRDHVYIDMEKENLRHAAIVRQDVATRRLALMGYDELKIEAASHKNGEYLKALSNFSGKPHNELISVINQTEGEVTLAHRLTGIE